MASRARTSKRRSSSGAYLTRDALRAIAGISDDQLRVWEYEELISHSAIMDIEGHREPVYSQSTLRRIRTIRSLAEDLGVNLSGIGVILHLLDRMGSR